MTRPLDTAAGPNTEPGPLVPLSPLPRSWRSLPRAFFHQARATPAKLAMTDTTDAELTYGQALLRALALGRVLSRLAGPAEYVGLLIPPTTPAAVANIALALFGKIAVNLNYTIGQDALDSCIDQCKITHIVTSRRVISKMEVKPRAQLIYLEDIAKQVTKADKAFAGLVAKAVPQSMLGLFLPGLRNESLDNTATIIFTSGSTGDPKGVILTQGNILSNVHQINSHLHLGPDEILLGILPFFHSFGYTVALWTVLCLGKTAVYHFNPLDARIVGNLCQKHSVTLLAASPTFMRAYVKKCDKEQFATVLRPILGAEKLKRELGDEIRQKLGIEPLEAYGCTETGPGVAANNPEDITLPDGRTIHANRPGTVGRLFPGTAVRTIDPDTGALLPPGADGIVLVKGPQIMKGYLNKPDITARVLQNGWYNTGDLGHLDADGFLTISGRISRFSKIGGEMVPHELVESAILGAATSEHPHVAVTSLPDPKRGERLVVLYDDLGLPVAELHKRLLSTSSLPRLWIPGTDAFVQVDHIPLLGTGKVDLREVRKIAEASADQSV